MNHYPRHVGDWMTATAHLTPIEECMYSRMVDQYYAREVPLPADVAACCRLVRAASPVERKAVYAMLLEFFHLDDDGWHQKRCDEELARYFERSTSASASARKRWSERNANASADAMRTHMPTHSDGNANQNQNQNQNQKSKGTRRKAAVLLPDGFSISDRVRAWATEKRVTRLEEHFEAFVGQARAKGYTYADWDEALMGAIRKNWAQLPAAPPPQEMRKLAL